MKHGCVLVVIVADFMHTPLFLICIACTIRTVACQLLALPHLTNDVLPDNDYIGTHAIWSLTSCCYCGSDVE